MQYSTVLEAKYEAAKARLQAAQQEKLEAAADFLAIRAALGQTLERLWPAPCQCTENAAHGREEHEQRRGTVAVG